MLQNDNLRTFGVTDINKEKSVSLLLGDIDITAYYITLLLGDITLGITLVIPEK